MLLLDAQTSGGLLICCPDDSIENMTKDLIDAGYSATTVIGEVLAKEEKDIIAL